MKRFFLILAICFGIVLPANGFPSSLIELKNGAKFVTSHHWEEGEFIKFYLYGGIVGFKKHQIKGIQPSDVAPHDKASRSTAKITARSTAHSKIVPSQVKKPVPPHPEKETVLMNKRVLSTKTQAISAAFREAKAKNDRKQMEAERKKLLSLKNELLMLQKEVKQAYQGELPAWWNE